MIVNNHEIIATEMQMLDSRSGGTSHFGSDQPQSSPTEPESQSSYASQQSAPAPNTSSMPPSPPPQSYDDFDDDIPF